MNTRYFFTQNLRLKTTTENLLNTTSLDFKNGNNYIDIFKSNQKEVLIDKNNNHQIFMRLLSYQEPKDEDNNHTSLIFSTTMFRKRRIK